MTTNSTFEAECTALGVACAAAKFRFDEKAPERFKIAFRCFRGRREFPTYFVRKWLSLRLGAVKRGMVLDPGVDAAFLEYITPAVCPVTLEPFEIDSKSKRNPSVDRLVNEGTYAAGNIGMFSVQANRAKGAKSFDDVAAIASLGEAKDGLDAIEWVRLASLMYGAWSVAVCGADPYILPFATFPGPKTFTSESQNVQWLLLRHCRDEVWPQSMKVWMQATADGGGSPAEFMRFSQALKNAIAQEPYAPTAWLVPDVFDSFVAWYNQCQSTVNPLLQSLRQKCQADVDADAIVGNWRVGSRYL